MFFDETCWYPSVRLGLAQYCFISRNNSTGATRHLADKDCIRNWVFALHLLSP